MSNSDEIRWRQRLENFGKAISRLVDACNQVHYTELEQAGLIKTFEFSFELSWKVLKDLLYFDGHEVNGPRAVFRKSFESGYIDEHDCEILLDALEKRNPLSHVYREITALEAVSLIKNEYHPALLQLYEKLTEKSRQ